jgi:hypothetical protein
VALLWDQSYLYFGFTAQETDVWGTLTERDSRIYEENDLEIFIAGKDAYYEFEINALNVIYEVFWIWKDIHKLGGPYWHQADFDPRRRTMVLDGVGGHVHPRGERWGFLDWDCPGLRHAVHVDGTLNKRDDIDAGWSAEIAIPWTSLTLLSDGRSLPPQDGDTWRGALTVHASRRSALTARPSTPAPAGHGIVMATTTRIFLKHSLKLCSPARQSTRFEPYVRRLRRHSTASTATTGTASSIPNGPNASPPAKTAMNTHTGRSPTCRPSSLGVR